MEACASLRAPWLEGKSCVVDGNCPKSKNGRKRGKNGFAHQRYFGTKHV